ncbi:MAG: Metal dependent phosphohydrolase [Candidatus Magnetoglobus multicellularis str. Araruama]|uniref:Metal dependent phosphohydrolase n=1 Tax=Candidatus Magnetoglobus multicellularis str. Araruama TaxID=890399 RepID=A0A1V1PF80_9BACT|nr:MAG: Metal dependent phosphohydrolase [Candidatus Magnetoglobus multicellularis str. Araruama]
MQLIKKQLEQIFLGSEYPRWILLFSLTFVLTLMLYPNLVVTKHIYELGDVAERNIKAPTDLLIEDKEATNLNRQQSLDAVLTVYDFDDTLVFKLMKRIQDAFSEMRNYISELEKQVPDQMEQSKPEPQSGTQTTDIHAQSQSNAQTQNTQPVNENSEYIKAIQSRKEIFLNKLGIQLSDTNYLTLVSKRFSKEIQDLTTQILRALLINGVVANKSLLLKEAISGIIVKNIASQKEQHIKDVKRYYGIDQAKAMVWIIGQPLLKDLDYEIITLIVDLVQSLIQPNVTINKRETEARKDLAWTSINPILFQVKAGEMLLREGERINKQQLLKLKALNKVENQGKTIAKSFGLGIVMLILLITFHIIYFGHSPYITVNYNKNLLFMSLILILFVFITEISVALAKSFTQNGVTPLSLSSMVFGIPVAAGAMTICLFMGMRAAFPFALLTSICAAILFENKLSYFVYFFINSAMGAYWLRYCRERNVFIKAGAKIGLLNIIIATALRAYNSELFLSKLFLDWIFGYIGGLSAGIVTAGMTPMMEITFAYTTDIKLLELANLDKPLLHRLMLEAPGTYHHSVIVGSMVEAAASEIGANPLLAKVCGYYHDIGKIKNPLYFIENQQKGMNRHNKLAPSMSSLIIISHVKHGVEMAKKYKLGKAICDTIQQHHGSSMISFFYEKARQQKGEHAVKEDDFRYPGPKPQTREAGLVMLADVVEAASRALENPTPARIQGLVQRLINKIFSDGQLDNCELTLRDLHRIANKFNKILNGIHHHRIEYTEAAVKNNQKHKARKNKQNGNHVKTVSAPQEKPPESQDDKSNGLKRLGLEKS